MKPKYLRKKKPSKLKCMLIIAGIIVVVAVGLVMLNGTEYKADILPDSTEATNEELATESSEAETEATLPSETIAEEKEILEFATFENGEIPTPYLTLHYPEYFADYLLVVSKSGQPYVLEFYAVLPDKAEQRIFDVCMGTGSDGNLGTVKTEVGEIPVSMTVYSFVPDDTWTQDEINTVLAMQEAANDLISCLGLSEEENGEKAPVLEEMPEEDKTVYFLEFETPYCLLRYPAIWGEWLHVEQSETEYAHSVEFYYSAEGREDILLFTVLLGGDEGEQLGVVANAEGIMVPVNLLMNAPSEEGLQEEELKTMYSMQEAVNQLLEQLPLQ